MTLNEAKQLLTIIRLNIENTGLHGEQYRTIKNIDNSIIAHYRQGIDDALCVIDRFISRLDEEDV